MAGRPPNERLLLAGLIAHPEIAIASALTISDWSDQTCRMGYGVLCERLAAGEPATPLTCGLPAGWVSPPSMEETGVLARDLWAHAVARRVAGEAERLLASGVVGDAFLEALGAAVDRVGRGGGSTPRVQEIAVARASELLMDRSASRVRTGYPELDRRLGGGMLRGVPLAFGARPGHGKSAFALGVAHNIVQAGGQVIVFSLEDAWRQYVDRVLSIVSRIPTSELERGGVDVTQLAQRLPKGWWLDDTAGLTSRGLCRRARLIAHRAGRVDLVVVDYIQLLRGEKASKNPHEVIMDAMADLAKLARDLDCPVMVLSQLNRGSEHEGREPDLTDLRASGSLEEVCKLVMLGWRPDFGSHVDQRFQVKVGKNSHGGVGKVLMGWDGPLTRVYDLGGV